MNRTKTYATLATAAWLLIEPLGVCGETRCLAVAPGECLQVTVTGHGQDVVLIPGLFGSAFSFRHVIPRLTTAGYRSIVIEPLGVGHSARPRSGDYSLTAQADRLLPVLDALEVKTPIVVAHSIGSSMALRLACRHPDRVRALVSRSGNSSWVTDDVVASYAAGPTRDLKATLEAFGQMAKAREPEALSPRLGEVRCPVRLLLGAAPHTGGPSEAEVALLQRSLPSFSVERVPGAGHFLFEENPDAVLAAVARMAEK